jgi:hypothetical protein
MKVIVSSSGKRAVQLTKSDWNLIGQQAGWLKTAQISSGSGILDNVKKQLSKLFELEEGFRHRYEDIPEMEEADGEDFDAGYGHGMSAQGYVSELTNPYLSIGYRSVDANDFWVYFYGNYEPSSVNAGRQKKVYIAYLSQNDILELVNFCKSNGWSCYVSEIAKKVLNFF